MAKNGDIQGIDSFIAKDVYFKGQLIINGSLQIDGCFEGNIELQNDFLLGVTGKVKTNIFAKKVIIKGLFVGNIEATEEIILENSAKVIGNIKTSNLFVDKGAVVLGKVQISSEENQLEKLSDSVKNSLFAKIPYNIHNDQE